MELNEFWRPLAIEQCDQHIQTRTERWPRHFALLAPVFPPVLGPLLRPRFFEQLEDIMKIPRLLQRTLLQARSPEVAQGCSAYYDACCGACYTIYSIVAYWEQLAPTLSGLWVPVSLSPVRIPDGKWSSALPKARYDPRSHRDTTGLLPSNQGEMPSRTTSMRLEMILGAGA